VRALCVLGLAQALACASFGSAVEEHPEPGRPPAPIDEVYRIRLHDRVTIRVHQHPEFSVVTRPSADGTLSIPAVGRFRAVGLTEQQLAAALRDELAGGFLVRPYVEVSVEDQQQMFYVTGEVQRPGAYKCEEGLTVRRALILAGGPTDRAAPNRIRLLRSRAAQAGRPPSGGHDTLRPGMDDPVLSNDTLVVPESLI
jgi:polysaccharide export outer membrane protein